MHKGYTFDSHKNLDFTTKGSTIFWTYYQVKNHLGTIINALLANTENGKKHYASESY